MCQETCPYANYNSAPIRKQVAMSPRATTVRCCAGRWTTLEPRSGRFIVSARQGCRWLFAPKATGCFFSETAIWFFYCPLALLTVLCSPCFGSGPGLRLPCLRFAISGELARRRPWRHTCTHVSETLTATSHRWQDANATSKKTMTYGPTTHADDWAAMEMEKVLEAKEHHNQYTPLLPSQ